MPEGRLKIIEGIMPVKEVLRLAKSYGTTLTVLLTAMMLIAFDPETDYIVTPWLEKDNLPAPGLQ